jgi:hypothetical protein
MMPCWPRLRPSSWGASTPDGPAQIERDLAVRELVWQDTAVNKPQKFQYQAVRTNHERS